MIETCKFIAHFYLNNMGNYLSDPSNTNNTTTSQATLDNNNNNNGVTLTINPSLAFPWTNCKTISLNEKMHNFNLVDLGGTSYTELINENFLADGHQHGFIQAITTAYKYHYPLVLKPQHIWLLILQAVSTHVNIHSDELQPLWVKHTGVKQLIVERDNFILGSKQTNDWKNVIIGTDDSFGNQIKKNMANMELFDLLNTPFNTLTDAEYIAINITIMDACKKYFEYIVLTRCGFSSIKLDGTYQDWQQLYNLADQLLTNYCHSTFATKWKNELLPVLRKLSTEYFAQLNNQEIDIAFWDSLCKIGGKRGSGAMTWFNGWMNVFFPYLRNNEWNTYCVQYDPNHLPTDNLRSGPNILDFPSGLSTAPVIWQYYATTIPLSFQSGFIGATQNSTSFEITPNVGWVIVKE
jgi:hypothetical protein